MSSTRFRAWSSALQSFLMWKVAGVEIAPLLIFGAIALFTFALLLAVRWFAIRYFQDRASRHRGEIDALLGRLADDTKRWVLLIVALFLGSLALPGDWRLIAIGGSAATIAVLLQAGLWGSRMVRFVIQHMIARQRPEDTGLASAAGALSFLSLVAMWSLVGLLMLAALNINITALIAGLGVGGVAVALAVQSILGDLFASLSILIDKPFGVGHFIVLDGLAGTVERVGVKSTRVRALSGEEIVVSNGDLLRARIHNYRRLFERRIEFVFRILYDTPTKKLAAIPQIVREIIEGLEKTRFDRAHFREFGESALIYEVVYFVVDPDHNLYMDIQQKINLGLIERFTRERIEFASPLRAVLIQEDRDSSETDSNGNDADHQANEPARPS